MAGVAALTGKSKPAKLAVKPAKLAVESKRGSVWRKLREAQRKCGCTTSTLKEVMKAVEPFCGEGIGGIYAKDEFFFEDNDAVVVCLHGCVKCNKFVFSPENNMIRCPKCQHPRFDQKKKANEVRCLLIFLIVC